MRIRFVIIWRSLLLPVLKSNFGRETDIYHNNRCNRDTFQSMKPANQSQMKSFRESSRRWTFDQNFQKQNNSTVWTFSMRFPVFSLAINQPARKTMQHSCELGFWGNDKQVRAEEVQSYFFSQIEAKTNEQTSAECYSLLW